MEDKEIVDLFWARSESAITEASKKYSRLCYSIALNILSNNADAEECVNDTLLRAWNSIPENRPVFLSAYLGKITRNLALNQYKHGKTQRRNSGIDMIFDELEDVISSEYSLETELESKRLANLISNFLRNLPEESMVVFVRRYWYLDSISDISSQFNISKSKIKSILFRCRNKLKIYLEKEHFSL